MDLRKKLRIAVVLHLLFIIVSIPVSKILDAYLPIQLRNYKLWVNEQGYNNVEFAIMLVATIVCVVHIVSSIGLFFLKPWAKWYYCTCVALILIISLFLRPTVEHAVINPIGGVSYIASGVVLYMIFFTNVISKK